MTHICNKNAVSPIFSFHIHDLTTRLSVIFLGEEEEGKEKKSSEQEKDELWEGKEKNEEQEKQRCELGKGENENED